MQKFCGITRNALICRIKQQIPTRRIPEKQIIESKNVHQKN